MTRKKPRTWAVRGFLVITVDAKHILSSRERKELKKASECRPSPDLGLPAFERRGGFSQAPDSLLQLLPFIQRVGQPEEVGKATRFGENASPGLKETPRCSAAGRNSIVSSPPGSEPEVVAA